MAKHKINQYILLGLLCRLIGPHCVESGADLEEGQDTGHDGQDLGHEV